jgi:RNA polymerase sigma-70 factor (ECF subfamily)
VTEAQATDAFSQHRDHLMALAYRMLGSRTEAEDAVQEAWLRYATADTGAVRDLRAWLTTVTGRICLDQLRSARVRREAYVGPWLPEPFVERLPAPGAEDPADRVERADRVSIALLVVLESLTPEQRLAFVLHDVFAVPFDQVAALLDTSVDNARQIASRARKAVAARKHRFGADRARQLEVQSAFMAAAVEGDLDALVKLLADDVTVLGDGGGDSPAARIPVEGALRVARFLVGLFRRLGKFPNTVEPVLVNGDLGIVVESTNPELPGRMVSTVSIGDDGRITGIFNILNPAKLGSLDEL